ncbi:hypothetical protein Bca101_057821 [Brassica carinata]
MTKMALNQVLLPKLALQRNQSPLSSPLAVVVSSRRCRLLSPSTSPLAVVVSFSPPSDSKIKPSSSPSPIALCFHHVTGSVSGLASVSSVSSSGSGEDQSQLTAPRKSNAASPKVVTRPTSPLHNRFSGMTLESSSTGRNNDGRSSEYHPLPLPPGSPTTSPSVVIMCSPTSPSSGVQGGSWVVGGSDSSSPLGVSKWKKGRFTESCTFGKVYQGLTVTRVAMCGDEFVLYSKGLPVICCWNYVFF